MGEEVRMGLGLGVDGCGKGVLYQWDQSNTQQAGFINGSRKDVMISESKNCNMYNKQTTKYHSYQISHFLTSLISHFPSPTSLPPLPSPFSA